MIPEEHNDRLLICFLEIIDQLLQRLVRQFDQRQVLVEHIAAIIGRVDAFLQIRILIRVAAVILHRHIEDECRLPLFLILISIDDMLHVRIVADIFAHISLVCIIVHEIQMFKTQQRINLLTVPARCIIRMLRVSLVSKTRQIACKRRRIACNILLIWDTSTWQKRHRIAGQEFKLGVCCIATAHGYLRVSGDCIVCALLHLMHKRHIIFVRLKISDNRKIRERLIHDHNDIRELIIRFALSGIIRFVSVCIITLVHIILINLIRYRFLSIRKYVRCIPILLQRCLCLISTVTCWFINRNISKIHRKGYRHTINLRHVRRCK